MILNNRFEKRNKITIPDTREEFNNWKVGDKISFATRTSFIYGVSAGVSSVNFAALAVSSGAFFVKYKKRMARIP